MTEMPKMNTEMPVQPERKKLQCLILAENYEWIKSETIRLGLRSEGYLVDDLVKSYREKEKK
jgi:hypothetical protein